MSLGPRAIGKGRALARSHGQERYAWRSPATLSWQPFKTLGAAVIHVEVFVRNLARALLVVKVCLAYRVLEFSFNV